MIATARQETPITGELVDLRGRLYVTTDNDLNHARAWIEKGRLRYSGTAEGFDWYVLEGMLYSSYILLEEGAI